jgi:hypothetical protein
LSYKFPVPTYSFQHVCQVGEKALYHYGIYLYVKQTNTSSISQANADKKCTSSKYVLVDNLIYEYYLSVKIVDEIIQMGSVKNSSKVFPMEDFRHKMLRNHLKNKT